jgi:hypothetical protein
MPKFRCIDEYLVARRREVVIVAETEEAAWVEFQRQLDNDEIRPEDQPLEHGDFTDIEMVQEEES